MIVAASSGGGFFFIIIIAFLLLWLIVVRPQRKRQNQQRALVNELQVGDEVLTAGGIYGTVSRLDEDEVTVRENREGAPSLELGLVAVHHGWTSLPERKSRGTADHARRPGSRPAADPIRTRRG